MTKGVNNPAAGKGKKRELEARGGALSKLSGGKKDPERKAKYDTGNPRPETPVGEFRQHTAGRKDDYFGLVSFLLPSSVAYPSLAHLPLVTGRP
jgi:hypothetical protein